MSQDQTSKPSTLNSRRTGIDRRWIPSTDHQPERRRGRDRRTIRKRSLLDPIAKNESKESRAAFPEIDSDPKSAAANPSAVVLTEKWRPLRPPAISKKKTSGDG